jgi:hypothetical protein
MYPREVAGEPEAQPQAMAILTSTATSSYSALYALKALGTGLPTSPALVELSAGAVRHRAVAEGSQGYVPLPDARRTTLSGTAFAAAAGSPFRLTQSGDPLADATERVSPPRLPVLVHRAGSSGSPVNRAMLFGPAFPPPPSRAPHDTIVPVPGFASFMARHVKAAGMREAHSAAMAGVGRGDGWAGTTRNAVAPRLATATRAAAMHVHHLNAHAAKAAAAALSELVATPLIAPVHARRGLDVDALEVLAASVEQWTTLRRPSLDAPLLPPLRPVTGGDPSPVRARVRLSELQGRKGGQAQPLADPVGVSCPMPPPQLGATTLSGARSRSRTPPGRSLSPPDLTDVLMASGRCSPARSDAGESLGRNSVTSWGPASWRGGIPTRALPTVPVSASQRRREGADEGRRGL